MCRLFANDNQAGGFLSLVRIVVASDLTEKSVSLLLNIVEDIHGKKLKLFVNRATNIASHCHCSYDFVFIGQ